MLGQKVITCLESSSPVWGWASSVDGGWWAEEGFVYLSDVVITSVRPPFEIPGFWTTDDDVKAKVFEFSEAGVEKENNKQLCSES